MEILTSRFGPVTLDAQARLVFPNGFVGLSRLSRFVAFPDPEVPELTWLQSTRDPAWAMAIVSPRTILPRYQLRVASKQLEAIRPLSSGEVNVYVTLNETAHGVVANMQAPILINRRLGLGMQLSLSDSRYRLRQQVCHRQIRRKSA